MSGKKLSNSPLYIDVAFLAIQGTNEYQQVMIDTIIEYRNVVGEYPRVGTRLVLASTKKYSVVARIDYLAAEDSSPLLRFYL